MRVVSSGWSFMMVVFYMGGLIRVISSEGVIAVMSVVSLGWSSFHEGGLIMVIFHGGGLL